VRARKPNPFRIGLFFALDESMGMLYNTYIFILWRYTMADEKQSGLTQIQVDALREISNIGAGSAVTALAQFIRKPVELEPTAEVIFNSTADFRMLFAGMPLVSVVSSKIPDKIAGHLLVIFEQEDTVSLAKLLLGEQASSEFIITDELGISAIKEVSGVMFSAYSAAMGNMASMSLMITPPSFDTGATTMVFDELSVNQSIKEEEITICFESSFSINAAIRIPGYMLFVPTPVSLNVLLKSLGVNNT